MRIKSIRIENFRCFEDETILLNDYTCFVGPNGAGKSTVLAALNVFFQEKESASTDTYRLIDEDYYRKNTTQPVRITLTFDNLSNEAIESLKDYVRQEELVVTAEAVFDEGSQTGVVRHFGQRLGFEEFRKFFEAVKENARVRDVLNPMYDGLREQYPDLPSAGSKDAKSEALRAYEAERSEECVLIPSEDNFYGIGGPGKLAPFVQWVFVPAVKDVVEEGIEARNTAFGKLIERAVRSRTNFDDELEALRAETLGRYEELLETNQESLSEIAASLKNRLESWAHSGVQLDIEWSGDPNKSVKVEQPVATVRTGDDDFVGNLARMGHGLQRSYLLALLQELAELDTDNAPTLLLGVEEPELYQHPPQERHLASVLNDLSTRNSQVLVTTHSPLFVSGRGFENIRLVRRPSQTEGSCTMALTFPALCDRIRDACGEDRERRTEGLVAKIHQSLQPGIAEMFFARVPILVEGLEDVAFITTELHCSNRWADFHRLGCHLIPVHGKNKLIKPLAIAVELGLPSFVVFDADNDCPDQYRTKHENDNKALLNLLSSGLDPFPDDDVLEGHFAVWKTNLGDTVKSEFGEDFDRLAEEARQVYAQEGGLEKQDLFIAEWVAAGYLEGIKSTSLEQLCTKILEFATAN